LGSDGVDFVEVSVVVVATAVTFSEAVTGVTASLAGVDVDEDPLGSVPLGEAVDCCAVDDPQADLGVVAVAADV
jgi:hypothetical protein